MPAKPGVMKADPDFASHNEAAMASAARELKDFVLSVESLADQRADLGREIADHFTVMKSRGYNAKALRGVLALRKRGRAVADRERQEVEDYMGLLDLR